MGAPLHRGGPPDVKPENIILRGSEAVLIDFDAARLHKPEHEMDTQILGTTGFAAPEQYGLSQSDLRTDIYSVGILINVMLTGEHPSKKLAEGENGPHRGPVYPCQPTAAVQKRAAADGGPVA